MRTILPCFVSFCGLVLAGCGANSVSAADAGMSIPDMARPVGNDQTVKILDGVVHLGGMLQNNGSATLPGGLFSKITLHLDLTCPAAGCDPYDRIARILVAVPGADQGSFFEIGRYITPFGVKGKWDIDVTDLAPILTGGPKNFRSYLETYAQNGQGWIVTASLIYVGGIPDPEPISVAPLPWDSLPVGDPPSQPIDKSLPPQTISFAVPPSRVRVRLLVTGHGQGNSDNCAEFCDLTHSVLVNGAPIDSRSLWRDDCDQNPIHQKGSWQYPREGWCPGSAVNPWNVDIPGGPPMPFTISYGPPGIDNGSGLQPYVNTCSPKNCDPKSCPFGGADPCTGNGGSHTDPRFVISAAVIGYR